MQQLSKNFSQLCRAGFEFDRWLELISDEQIYEIGRNSNFPLHPSHYWTHVAGEPFVGFIGRVERFEHDFGDFLCRVGIDPMMPCRTIIGNPESPPAEGLFGYRYLARMNAKSIDKINRLFERDFDIFGYERVAG